MEEVLVETMPKKSFASSPIASKWFPNTPPPPPTSPPMTVMVAPTTTSPPVMKMAAELQSSRRAALAIREKKREMIAAATSPSPKKEASPTVRKVLLEPEDDSKHSPPYHYSPPVTQHPKETDFKAACALLDCEFEKFAATLPSSVSFDEQYNGYIASKLIGAGKTSAFSNQTHLNPRTQ